MLIKNANIVGLFGLERGDIRIRSGRISEIGKDIFPNDEETVVDAGGFFVTPGFVDIHTHGGYGSDFMDCTEEAFDNALAFHGDNGTTTVVPTSCTAQKEQIIAFLDFSRGYINSKSKSKGLRRSS